MPPKTQKLLEDILDAARFIADHTRGVSEDGYIRERLLRQAVERNFEIIGEAVSALRKLDPATAGAIGDADRIVDFRNLLIHSYAKVDDARVWAIIQGSLPKLLEEVEALLAGKATDGTQNP